MIRPAGCADRRRSVRGFTLLEMLVVIVLVRIGSLAQARETAAREAVELRTRLDVLAATNADFERDLRQDFAAARSEQSMAAQQARVELADTLARQALAQQQQLGGIAATQVEQLKQFGDRLSELAKSNEQRLEADWERLHSIEEELSEFAKLLKSRDEELRKLEGGAEHQ